MDKQAASYKTVVFTFLLVLTGYIFYRLAPIIGLFLIALLIVVSVEPMIKNLQKFVILNKNISRGAATLVTYILLVLAMGFMLTVFLPPFISQVQKLLKNSGQIINSLQLAEKVGLKLPDIIPQVSKISEGLVSLIISTFSNLAAMMTLLIVCIYISLDWPRIKELFFSLFPERTKIAVEETVTEIETSIGAWVKGESLLMLIIGSFTFIGLVILKVEYALALALIAGLTEAVPVLGPVIAALIAATVAFSVSPVKGLGVIVLFIIIQQLENNLLVPKIMQKVSGFSPILILFALSAGARLFGILGAVLAVPVTMIIAIILKRLLRPDRYVD